MREPIITTAPRRPGRCSAEGCNKKTPTPGAQLCNTCRSHKARLKNPYSYAYSNLKKSAKVRHIPFDLTLEEFTEWCKESGYILKKGLRADGLTVSRKNEIPERGYYGYRLDNIGAETLGDNVKHYYQEKKCFQHSAEHWRGLSAATGWTEEDFF